MLRSSSGRAIPPVALAALAVPMVMAACATGPGPSPPVPVPSGQDPLPPPVLVTPTTQLPPLPDTAPRGPLPVSPEVEGTYQARLAAASSPGRLVTLELRPGGLAVMGTDPLDGRPPVVRGGSWRPDGDGRVALELASPGAAGRERIVFRVVPDTLRAVEIDRAAYGSAGLDLVLVEHPFSAFSQPGTWRAADGTTLTLRPDRTFLLRERGGVGLGRWSVLESQTLVLYGDGTPRRYTIEEDGAGQQWLVSGAARLGWVERVDPFGEPFRMRGTYVYLADAGLFTECRTANRFPVAQEGANAELERAYQRARSAPGAPVLAEIRGRLVMRVNEDTGRPEEAVVVEQVAGVSPGGSCEGGGPPPARPAASPLEGTRWELAELRGRAVAAGAGARQTLEFAAGARVTGDTGCNVMNGSYETGANGALRFGPLATTRRACIGPEPPPEQAYLDALAATTRHAITGGMLVLYAGSDVVARFRRAGG